jgi:hypothetical protein
MEQGVDAGSTLIAAAETPDWVREVRTVTDPSDRGDATGRLLFKDIVPYDMPTSLEALRGPATGMLDLPVTVYWGPHHRFDLGDPADLETAYQALVREGTTADQESLLNDRLLRRVWPELMLPERCRRVWEERFPGLAA